MKYQLFEVSYYSIDLYCKTQIMYKNIFINPKYSLGFPSSSASKESACNAGDPDLVPGLGGSPGEGISYPLQYSWASLVTQKVKNHPAMWDTWVWSLGQKNPLEEGVATHSSILAWRIPWTEEPGGLSLWGCKGLDTIEQLSTAQGIHYGKILKKWAN